MARPDPASESGDSSSRLLSLKRGDLLGHLDRGTAERSFRLYQERATTRILWSGEAVEGHSVRPDVSVHIPEPDSLTSLECHCSLCGILERPCFHAAAALLQWFDVRATLVRLGPGSAWRAHSRHPFVAPARGAEDRVDLSHLTGADLRSALELQLSLQKTGSASVRLVGHEVQITVTLPSGDHRMVVFSASVLPSALLVLRSLPRMDLGAELEQLELSEVRLHPTLAAAWTDEGILLEPGYRLGNRSVFSLSELEGKVHGRWARVGHHLCRVLDPPTHLVPFHRKGRQMLKGREALRFLTLDHPQLTQYTWYLPQGALATFKQPVTPRPTRIDANSDKREMIRVRPYFTAEDETLDWDATLSLLDRGFARLGGIVVQSPDLSVFENAGFQLPSRGAQRGLKGNRLAFIRVVAETDIEIQSADPWIVRLVELLRGSARQALAPPPGLRSTLRPYQADGVAWLWERYLAGIGALLADDMGLGKTHQIMGFLCHVREQDPQASVLVVCPRGVLEHWNTLLETYAPELGVHLFHGADRHLPRISGTKTPIVLTTYDILVRSANQLKAVDWEVIVFDEAQRIKNSRTKAARSSRGLSAKFRAALSGTPLENRLLELWSVVDLILPGYLGPEQDFRKVFRNPSQTQLGHLRRRLGVLTLRRLKEQVLADLPEKVEDIRYCSFTSRQRAEYQEARSLALPGIAAQLGDSKNAIPYMHIFALMTRLKQVCDHSALGSTTTPIREGESGKLEVFDEIIDEALESGQQIVVFSQYVKMLKILSTHLDQRGMSHAMLTGASTHRGRIVRRFNSGQHESILLASLLAGGVGIDLTGASVVVHYDRWWNPAKENQATDRVHRMGQRRFVQVFKLVTRNSIEERINELIQRKIALFEEVVAPTEAVVQSLSRDEIARLLDLEIDDSTVQ